MIRLSQIFRPFNVTPRNNLPKIAYEVFKDPNETASKGYKLLCRYGFIRQSSHGLYNILPMGQRVIEKLIKLLDRKMARIGAQKSYVPLMSKKSLWTKSGIYDECHEELFEVEDRSNSRLVLNPTHEQSYSHLLSTELMSYRDFPKLLYQIAPKFRNEHRPKLGLLRSSEFLMKDLYSFDIGPAEAAKTYERVTEAYDDIFNSLGIKCLRVQSGKESHVSLAHEYFYFSEVGDDKLYTCQSCDSAVHLSALEDRKTCPNCMKYLSDDGYLNAIEVAHTFSFGTYFSTRLGSCYVDVDCQRSHLHLCSFGIGVSRLVSACAEVLATKDEELRWPLFIAPYTVCVIPPKAGSKEERQIKLLLPDFYHLLEAIPALSNDILIDDRTELTIGKRLLEAKLSGYPYIIVIGKDAVNATPLYEVFDLNKEKRYLMPKFSLLQFLFHETEILTESRSKVAYIQTSPAENPSTANS